MQTEIPTPAGKILGTLKQKRAARRLLIVCNGLHSSTEHPATKAITQKLYERGHALFAFNFSNADGLDLEQRVEDIIAIINHFNAYDEYILLGGSFGALSIAAAAHRSPKIKGLVTMNGFFGSAQLGVELLPTYLMFRLLGFVSARHRQLWQFYRREFKPAAITIPTLVIHSKADKEVLITQSQNFFKQISGPKVFETLQTSDHNLQPGDEIDVIVLMIDSWLRKLKPAATNQA